MNLNLKRTLLPGLMAASLAGGTLVPAKPAAADMLRDIGIGAGAGVVTGAVRGNGAVINNAIKGAAAGAAVHAVHGTRKQARNRRVGNLGQDVGVGAAASTATGLILHGTKNPGGDAIDGAAAGAAINVLTNGHRNR
ncbi:hypothetical protein [Nostoc sp. 106C]|uniref:hypothetical protein n=1 Tax=Nostoc sp. 106C TaxID=1932667 RepID=UPI000A3A1C18|nr:hypothetical protein [Nostoc sp. 106C]OUL24533.1 hypothetical protein BV378_19330 [Nostoc sp. RF31YmG]OUL30054.1 hypothetical protein BV375_14910 [Nostoc sp. 106C]